MALLLAGVFEVYLGVESGSKLATEGDDGARYWMAFLVVLG